MNRQLYGIYTPSKTAIEAQIAEEIIESIEAGLSWLQIRDKSKDNKLWPLWHTIALKAAEYKVQLIINDNVDLLLKLQHYLFSSNISYLKPGLHLGQDDMALINARQKVSEDTLIGITCHNSITLAHEAVLNGADYVAFGRFFPSVTKPAASPASLEIINQFQNQNSRNKPIAVIGGIDAHNIQQLLPGAASLYAVSNALWGQASITAAIQQLNRLLSQ